VDTDNQSLFAAKRVPNKAKVYRQRNDYDVITLGYHVHWYNIKDNDR